MADVKQSTKAKRSSMRQLEIRTRRMVDDSMAGAYHSVFKGRGMDFDEVREYSPGDEVRTIDWNVTARAGRAFVKKFTEERELTIFLVVDISASGNFGSGAMAKRDLAAEVASVLAFSAIRNSDKVGLILYTDRIERYLPPKKGRRHVLRVVRDILFHEPQGIGTDTVKTLDVAESRAAPARRGVPDIGLRDQRRSRRCPRGSAPSGPPDESSSRLDCGPCRRSAREGAPQRRDHRTGRRGNRRDHRARHGARRGTKAFQRAFPGAFAASAERSSGRGGRHRAAAHGCALHSRAAAIFQIRAAAHGYECARRRPPRH